MKNIRFNGKVPHLEDTSLVERCLEEIRNYEIYAKYVEPRDHTISYIASAYLELKDKYEELLTSNVNKNSITGF